MRRFLLLSSAAGLALATPLSAQNGNVTLGAFLEIRA